MIGSLIDSTVIQIQHLLKLNSSKTVEVPNVVGNSNTTFVKVKYGKPVKPFLLSKLIQIQHLLKLNSCY